MPGDRLQRMMGRLSSTWPIGAWPTRSTARDRPDDPAVNDQVWAATLQTEQAQDSDRRGVALIVELERVAAEGIRPQRNFVMARMT